MKRFYFGKIVKYLAVIILLIFLHFVRILSPIENGLLAIINPFARTVYSVSIKIFSQDGQAIVSDNMANELELLKDENKQLSLENAKFKVSEEENLALRKQLNFVTEKRFKYVLADILSRKATLSEDSTSGNIMISKGESDGIRAGLAVIDSDGAVVGKIILVEKNISKACLVIEPDCQLAVAIQDETNTAGLTKGDLGLTVKMDFIPQTEQIKIGDNVVTSGLEENVPRGLFLGKIAQVSKESNEIWQRAVIEPAANLNNLFFVSILIP
jgi:rod shape-determining protein MreC